jgi:gentisate 1,2-dioxygenase
MTQPHSALADAPSLGDLRTALEPLDFMGGWDKHEPSLWKEPRTEYQPMIWKWADAKIGLDAAGRLINAEQTERRNLFMVNPIPDNHYDTLRTLVTAYQMIMPGEKARTHRHSPNALRFVLDCGSDCYTVVDGVRIDMRPNDVLLTPGMYWHGHGNEGKDRGYWIDYLDVPMVHRLEPMFFDVWDGFLQPADWTTREHAFVFPWEKTSAQLKNEAQTDAFGRTRIRLDAPSMPTTGLYMQKLAAGAAGKAIRSTENQIFTVVSGKGETKIGDRVFEWSRGDTFCIPSWKAFRHAAREDAVLFNVSDDVMQSKLGFLRTQVEAGA